ncbi:hypothetical protein ACM66B_005938 [Microbotryomycetes sp. NB124-2]
MSSEDDEDSVNAFFNRPMPVRMPSPTMSPGESSRQDGSSTAESSDLEELDKVVNRARKDKKGKGTRTSKTIRAVAASTSRAWRVRADDDHDDDTATEAGPSNRKRSLIGTASQVETFLRGGNKLYEMARQHGWEDDEANQHTSESVAGDGERRRAESTSTKATTPSDDDHENVTRSVKSAAKRTKAAADKGKGKALGNRASKTKPATMARPRKRRSASDSPQLEPVELLQQPPPPDDFWGVKERPKAKKRSTGEMTISEQLQASSKLIPAQRGLDIEDDVDEVEESESGGEEPRGYERVADKQKRLRKEQLEVMKEKRASKTGARTKNPAGPLVAALAKQRAAAVDAESECPLCSRKFSRSTIQAHAAACSSTTEAPHLASQSSEIDIVEQPPPIRRSEAELAPNDGDDVDQNDRLARELFPSPRNRVARTPKKSQGQQQNKKAVAQVEADADEFDLVLEDDDLDEQVWAEIEQAGPSKQKRPDKQPAQVATLYAEDEDGAVFDDEEDELEHRGPVHRLGPPTNGSPPPAGSIYISTMPSAIRKGFESMFAVKAARGDAVAIDDDNYGLSAQKLQATAATKRKSGGSRARGRGRPRFFRKGRGKR